jgi:CRISPR-associated endonuclease/helicase Cas3
MARGYYQAIREGSSQQESKKLLEALRTLDYERLDRFRLIDEQPSSSVYVEVDEKASRIWNRYIRMLESKKTSLEKKEEFLRMRADFYSYVINVSAWDSAGLQENKGFFHIPNSKLRTFYDKDTGFARETQSRSRRRAEALIY